MNVARNNTATGTTATVKRGRFAPSPTGRLHAGSLLAAVGSYLDARQAGGEWIVRIEDIDRDRTVPGAADDILRTLESYGLEWDGAVLYQHTRTDAYRAALEALRAQGLVYACDCAGRAYRSAGQGGEARYPGHCRHRTHPPTTAHAWRLDTRTAPPYTIADRLQGNYTQDVAQAVGDFVLWRKDGWPAYQLAVVVDDAHQGISDVVRGMDLLDNTPRQRLLQDRLQAPAPRYAHLPLLRDRDGSKLSKSTQALPVAKHAASATLAWILRMLQHPLPDDLGAAAPREQLAYAVAHWDTHRLAGVREISVPAG